MIENEFYRKVVAQLDASQISYKTYMNNQFYINARDIYTINRSLVNFIEANSYLIKEDDLEGFKKLITHFKGWKNQFDEEVNLSNPKDDDIFVFERNENALPFPATFVLELQNRIKLNG